MSAIFFHFEEFKPFALPEKEIVKSLLALAAAEEGEISEINYIFCTDEFLLEINKQYLNHDYYTDIITFDYTDSMIAGDIYISLDRVFDNSDSFKTDRSQELCRVMAHGLLHLLGYKDKTDAEQELMTAKEDAYLSLFPSFNVPRGTLSN